MVKRDKIGILDLQGGVHEHIYHLQVLGIEPIRVKEAYQFNDLAGLILPGGESSTIIRLLNIFNLTESLINAFNDGMKIWGTCAGAILLAKEIIGESTHLGLMDISIMRNAFGAQLDSFTTKAIIPKVSNKEIELTFIRAPKIISVKNNVDILLKIDDYIAAAEDDNCLATIFHPELTSSLSFHKYFIEKSGLEVKKNITEKLDRKSWMKNVRIIK